ncbi:putative membrane protein [Sphingomonas sp. BE270]|uniref:hypothetical protein n=1 Tax=unclassified Sphingomonas TaxID=196159 RepID=UPI000A57A940|nr:MULTISPECIES: hypothetical protein [unclassified Sphingomonas]MDR6849843.1 putative membrane protein [Sphingomonas sp. BE137]MDR7257344.1 putative membrane protein [Sphingomonas sp. BE270]RUN78129.1 hypothetical protein EJC47_02045 [Sphingomonas sp. TF3]
MKAVKALALVAGVVLLAFGLLFAGQGLGIILWPASSFMLAQREWAVYGALIALAGVALLWWSRR